MKDFSEKYRDRKVVHFGIWAEEDHHEFGKRDAWAVLKEALNRTFEEDVRTPDLEEALQYMERHSERTRPYKDFRKALEIQDAIQRKAAVREALHRIWKEL